ncbi:MAG: FtsX-like permease family protein [Candidatus Thermoplasmatota archaeon]|nr:FtsX-like permease family protein [Candidatus Thermoplasmatota archaeon]
MTLAGPWTWPRRLVTAASGLLALILVAWLSFSAQIDESDWTMGRTLTSIGISAIAGLVVWTSVQWFLSSRHRMLATMARNNLIRRKRNTVLVIAGLLVGSAIVSSSLVIGDSLDSTMEQHILIPLGDTDYYIRGEDPVLGQWVEWNQSRADNLSDELMEWGAVHGARPGLAMTISVLHHAEDLAEPRGDWYAFDAARSDLGDFDPIGGADGVRYSEIAPNHVVINEEMSERVLAEIGDELEIFWLDIDLTEGIARKSANLTIQAIIPDISTGHFGSKSPLIFTSLQDAQLLTGKQDTINQIAVSVKGDGNDALRSDIKAAVNQTLIAEDAGLTIESDASQGMVAVARTSGMGLLDVGEVSNLTAVVDATSTDVKVLEIIQVPLYNVAQDGINVSGLASNSISAIEQTDGWDWYATASGLSMQDSKGQWWIWEADESDDKSVRDLLIMGPQQGLAAHSDGVREIDVTPGASDTDHLSGVDVEALGASDSLIFALEIDDGDVILHHTDTSLTQWSTSTILDDGTAMNLDMVVDSDEIHIRIGRLLGSRSCSIPLTTTLGASLTSHCADDLVERRDLFSHQQSAWVDDGQDIYLLNDGLLTSTDTLGLPNGTLIASHEQALWIEDEGLWSWNGTGFESIPIEIPPAASLHQAALSLNGTRLIVTTGDGVAISDADELSGRIPNRIKIEIARVPLTVIALSGDGDISFPEVDDNHLVISQWAGKTLDVEEGEFIRLRGLLPASRGMLHGEVFYVDSANLTLPAPPGQPSFDAVSFGIVSMNDAEILAAGNPGDRTIVMLSGSTMMNASNFSAIESAVLLWADEQADLQTTDLNVFPIKQRALQATETIGESFSILFLIFGSFVIFAGILLVINIFVMLADERKPEMGMARAIGMQRGDLRSLFVQEGAFLGLISSALGALLGVGFGWVIMQLMGSVFSEAGGEVIFDWTFQSLLGGFVTGFLVAWLTLWLTSLWISRLNVVAAIRDIPTRFTGGLPWWSILVTLFFGLASLVFFALAFLIGEPDDSYGTRHAWWILGGYTLMFAALPPLFWLLRVILPENINIGNMRLHKPVILPRLILTILGLSMVLWGWIGDPISDDWEQGPFSFILLGIFLVTAGVLLLSSLAPIVARFVARILARRSKRIASVLPTSLSYPLASPFRTAMSMGMFSIVIFAVVVLSGYSSLLGNYLDELSEEVGGDYEIASWTGGDSLDRDIGNWNLSDASVDDFDSMTVMSIAAVNAERLDGAEESMTVMLRGFDDNFTNHGALSLQTWATELGDTEQEVWNAVLNDDSLVIVDYSLTPQPAEGLDPNPTLNLQIYDTIVISDPFNNGINRTVDVAGIMTPSASFFMNGIYISSELAEDRFDAEPRIILFSVSDDVGPDKQQELADEIERGMIEHQVNTVVIGIYFAKVQSFALSMLDLLQAFLALGLAVGIAGLAVITIRNVSERRHQIGILRALGFQRGMVVSSFLIELTWISFLGILNGALVGIGFHYALYDRFLREEGASFMMPWAEISMIVFGAYLLTLIATIWPVLKASSISPAEALRDVQ